MNLTTKQVSGIEWLLTQKRGLLGDDVGCGKTATALHAAQLAKPSKRVLVIASAIALRDTWMSEIGLWLPDQLPYVVSMKADTRPRTLKALYRGPMGMNWKWCLCPIDYTRTFMTELCQWPWDVIIVDEAHHFGGYSSQRTKGLIEVIKLTNPKYVWLMSADFVRNKATDAYTPLHIARPDIFPHNGFMQWAREYVGMYKQVTPTHVFERIRDKPKDPAKFQEMFSKHILARPRDNNDYAKPEHPVIVRCNMSGRQLDAYNQMKKEWWFEINEDEERGASNALVRDTFLKQICISHHLLMPDESKCDGAKIDSLLEVIGSTTEQVLVCCTYAEPIRRLGELHGWSYFTGDHGDSKKALSDWRGGKTQVLAVTYKVGGESLNLQNGSVFCALDYDWVPKTYHQAVGRLARKGQTKPVLPYILVANNTIDDYVLRVNKDKESIIECSMPTEELSMEYYRSIETEVTIS